MKQKRLTSLRAIAQRSKRQTSPYRRQHLAKAAEHYRELAELEEEVSAIRPKPPVPSV